MNTVFLCCRLTITALLTISVSGKAFAVDSIFNPLQITLNYPEQVNDINYETTSYDQVRNRVCLALTLYGESRGESDRSKIATAWAIKNRVDHKSRFRDSYCKVVLRRSQIESLGPNRKLRKYVVATKNGDISIPDWIPSKLFKELYTIAMYVDMEVYDDPTNGADHFWNPKLQKKLKRNPPFWTTVYPKVAIVGNHHYHDSELRKR